MCEITVRLIVDKDFEPLESWGALRKAAITACQSAHVIDSAELSVVVTSAEAIHDLNRQFVGKDAPTDVLAFSTLDDPSATEPGELPYLGDVIIAYSAVKEQAAQIGHSIERELQLLTIHGVLHLLGYDHDTPERKARMWALQEAALDSLQRD